ncbi:hypothetical protein BDF21DRAFT_452185 [Thamnidium elegans]|nr:hypothetical protein BDF21DRAFT_452185 [Thamnidium elegans]
MNEQFGKLRFLRKSITIAAMRIIIGFFNKRHKIVISTQVIYNVNRIANTCTFHIIATWVNDPSNEQHINVSYQNIIAAGSEVERLQISLSFGINTVKNEVRCYKQI